MISVTYPKMLYVLIPLIAFIIILLKIEFVRGTKEFAEYKTRLRWVVAITRILAVALLVFALSVPFSEITLTESGEPEIIVLIDNSTSMKMLDYNTQEIVNSLKQQIPTTSVLIGEALRSNLADGILQNMDADKHILLISDGYNNYGSSLGDAALSAAAQNISINALELSSKQKDVSVWIDGPNKVISNVDNAFTIYVKKINTPEVSLKISVDGETVYDKVTSTEKITINKKFETGNHEIIAELDSKDYFEQNNIFHKTIKVIDKPKVLLITKRASELTQILEEFYETEAAAVLPEKLDPYYAIITDDVQATSFTDMNIDKMRDYLLNQNGMFVIGGFNSFDRGSYKNSNFEEFLPVRVGAAEKKKGDNDIVIVIDITGSASGTRYMKKAGVWTEVKDPVSQLDIMKSFAVGIVKELNLGNRVGAIAFTDRPFLIQEIRPLYETKKDLLDKISRLTWTPGASNLNEGLKGGYELIRNQARAKNIILLSDGKASENQRITVELANAIANEGIRIYVVGVGRSDSNIDQEFLGWVAEAGNGIYFRADQSNRLSILFGDPEDVKQGQSFQMFILNTNHFITKDLTLNATMNGFNQVIPKNSARMLITSTAGDPALTVWYYGGLGRVASLNVFSGGSLGELLNEQNSELLARTTNWAIGDPERKKPYSIMIDDGRINEETYVRITSDKPPVAEGLAFTKTGQNAYESNAFYPEKMGFNSILEQPYATNYELEYQYLGLSPVLSQVVESTGGKLFKPGQTKEIIEHVKKLTKKNIVKRVDLTWPLIILAAIILLVEILIRKIYENKA